VLGRQVGIVAGGDAWRQEVNIWLNWHLWWLVVEKVHHLRRYRIYTQLLTSGELRLHLRSHRLPLSISHCLLHHQLVNLVLIDSSCLDNLHNLVHVRRIESRSHLKVVELFLLWSFIRIE